MSLTLVVYLPGSGGNHLKNLLCLDSAYCNHTDLTPEVYENPDPQRPPGEVWCVGGRNLQDIFFERMIHQPNCNWVLAAHLGEMFQRQTQLQAIEHKKIVVLNITNTSARQRLYQRQLRLGQTIHPYWLDEEFVWMYSADTVAKIFNTGSDCYHNLCIKDFWSDNFVQSRQFAELEQFLGTNIDHARADLYHRLWCRANNFE
jgi:hypothetical protein